MEKLQFLIKLKTIKKIILVFLVFLSIYISFYNLWRFPLENWDEAFYADVTRTMLRTGDFITLTWNKVLFIEKPPMHMWLSSLASVFFGLNEFSFRVTSASSAVIISIIILKKSYSKYGIFPAILASLTLILNDVFIWRARSGNTDLLAALLILLVYFVMIGKNTYKYPILGFLFACIFLTKASLVFYPIFVFGIIELLYERKNILKNIKQYIIGFLIFLLLVGSWLFLGYIKMGPHFVNYFLFQSDQNTANISLTNLNKNFLMYAYYSLQRRFFYVLIFGLVAILITKIKEKQYAALFLFSVALIVQLSLSKTMNNWYIIPSIPFWSLAIAFGTYTFIKLFKKITSLYYLVIFGIIILTSYVSYKTFTVNIQPILGNYSMTNQAEACRKLNKITLPNDVIIRLDHLYPSTVYYTDRKVYSSPPNSEDTSGKFIGRTDLINQVIKGKYKWISGPSTNVGEFLKTLKPDIKYEIINVNVGEKIIHFK